MRSIAFVAVVALSSPARADDDVDITAALHAKSTAAIEPLLANSVRVGPILFGDVSCRKQFGASMIASGADRHALAACLAGLDVSPLSDAPLTWYELGSWALFAVSVNDHKIVAIGPFDPRGADTSLPTLEEIVPAADK